MAEILQKDFSCVYKERAPDQRTRRPILSPERTMGSVIQLFTPSPEYKDEHNAWLRALPYTIRELLFTVKRYYRPEWGDNWREHFAVDRVNGILGHELKFDSQKLVNYYLRVGYDQDGSWRIYKLRPDFHPAEKVQVEDDITVSIVLPRESLSGLDAEFTNPSVKLVLNCETFLFQRPDDAIHRGADKQAEADIASPGTFLSNYEPFTRRSGRAESPSMSPSSTSTRPHEGITQGICGGALLPPTLFPRRIRAWSMASHRRIRATCKQGRTWNIRAKHIWRRLRRASSAKFPLTNPSISR